ncbi:MAG: hypothetical protein ABJC26_05180 [Gemmatimonadaceae bacterium]
MWQTTHSLIIPHIDKAAVWSAWADFNHWNDWDKDLEYATLDGKFSEGKTFVLKPRGGPRVKISILRHSTRFPATRLVKICAR